MRDRKCENKQSAKSISKIKKQKKDESIPEITGEAADNPYGGYYNSCLKIYRKEEIMKTVLKNLLIGAFVASIGVIFVIKDKTDKPKKKAAQIDSIIVPEEQL